MSPSFRLPSGGHLSRTGCGFVGAQSPQGCGRQGAGLDGGGAGTSLTSTFMASCYMDDRECGTVCWLCWTLQYEYACFNKIAFPSSLSIPVTGCLAEPLFGEIQLIMTVAFDLALQSVSALMLRPISDQTPAARLMRLIHLLANFSQRTSPNESEIATPASITAVQAPIGRLKLSSHLISFMQKAFSTAGKPFGYPKRAPVVACFFLLLSPVLTLRLALVECRGALEPTNAWSRGLGLVTWEHLGDSRNTSRDRTATELHATDPARRQTLRIETQVNGSTQVPLPSVVMAESPDPCQRLDRPTLERRRSKNPLKNMMQHLTVDGPDSGDEPGSPRRRESHQLAQEPEPLGALRRLVLEPHGGCGDDGPPKRRSHSMRNLHELRRRRGLDLCRDRRVVYQGGESGRGRWLRQQGAPCPAPDRTRREPLDGDLSALQALLGCAYPRQRRGRMFDMAHPARGKAAGLAPGFLGVVPSSHGRITGDWFRKTGMLLRTMPEAMVERQPSRRGRSPAGGPRTPEPPALTLNDTSWLQQGIWGREIGQSADLGVARDWMHFCDEHHEGRCSRQLIQAEMPGFRLIDCSASPPRVVEGSITADYAALSYVLGKPITGSWPRVVQDAAIVTRELGIRYLWVDQLCMEGTTSAERAQQIARMDDIFEGAALTIIAAHGRDATQGLAGVGSTPRVAQPKYHFADSNITLVSTMHDPRLSIQESTWYSRGWTYQEGLLARRRLVFTAQQMYWECGGMVCPETLVMPLGLYHDARERRMADFVRPGLFNGVSYVDGSWEAWKRLPRPQHDDDDDEQPSTLSIFRESDRHIVSYAKRRLTYDEDSLSAFLGISRRLERTLGRGKLGNLVGIPLWAPAGEDGSWAKSGAPRTKDVFALSTCFWHHTGSSGGGGEEPRRRPHLPSWTWAGWEGAVELYSSIVVAAADHAEGASNGSPSTATGREAAVAASSTKKLLNHHYVSATHLTRNEPSSLRWTYSPAMVVLAPDGSVAYDFSPSPATPPGRRERPPPVFRQGRYALRVSDPLVLDRVKARAHESGSWVFNDVSVDVRMSRGGRGTGGGAQEQQQQQQQHGTVGGTSGAAAPARPSAIREYIERHARGEQMTVLWFVEDATVMLLVVERSTSTSGRWERVGRARMAFPAEAKEVVRRFGKLEVMLNHLPLRRLGEDIVIE
ncbi:putative tol protein [Purpureocillium lilacinum]|uniref:Putative tol protein n=1 Tax=Purpureocillium lilacinum TaxID=33203 RepID=A0A2U3EAG3_PURLI|nr:putative tol protein [Purpureocillium lilacinum]